MIPSSVRGDRVHRTDIWETKDKRVIVIKEMDDDHLVNTILYMDRRTLEIAEKKRKFTIIIIRRVQNMLHEAKKRGLMPRICIAMGDTRGAVLETREINSRIVIHPGWLKGNDHA